MRLRSITQTRSGRRDTCLLFLVALLAGCNSAPETITLENGATAYPINCFELEQCTQSARQICKRSDYFVHERTQHVPKREKDRHDDWAGAASVGDVRGTKKNFNDRDDELRPWWSMVVECTPPSDEFSSSIQIKDNIARNIKVKSQYIAAVCELRDPELRRIEMQIARRDYGDFSCEEIHQQPKGGHQRADY